MALGPFTGGLQWCPDFDRRTHGKPRVVFNVGNWPKAGSQIFCQEGGFPLLSGHSNNGENCGMFPRSEFEGLGPMRRFIVLLIGSVLVIGSAEAQGLDGDKPPICKIASSLAICELKSTEQTYSQLARERLDSEFATLNEDDPNFGRSYALKSFSAADLSSSSQSYKHLRDRALITSFAAEAETGQRYFSLSNVGQVAKRAGDKRTALLTINERLILVRNRPDDQDWNQYFADVVTTTTKEQAWTELSVDAVNFGDLKKAKSIIQDAYPDQKKPSFRYLLGLSRVENIAGNHDAAESSARAALKAAPYTFCEKSVEERVEQVLELEAHLILIESLVAQEKSYLNEANKYRRELTSECTYLSRHTQNFYSAATDLAEFAPELAREFFDAGFLIDQVDAEEDVLTGNYFKEEACKALQDLNCLRAFAKQKESALIENNLYRYDSVAMAFIEARDFDSAERIMLLTAEGDDQCFRFSRHFGIRKLIESGYLGRAKKWLEDWTVCRTLSERPNWQTGFGDGGNLWSELAVAYARLSKALYDASMFEEAYSMAANSLATAIETENTWRVDYLGYRANDLGAAYGAAYGAFARLNE